jgi:hypothetical protein
MQLLIVLSCLLFMASCASTYKPLRPDVTYFQSSTSGSEIDFSYKLGVLREHKNKKYAKREDKNAIRVASIRIINNTDKEFTIGKEVFFYSGNSEAYLLSPELLHKDLKQGVAIYLLYLLLTGNEGAAIALGPGITIGNMAVAGTANKKFLDELNRFNVINKTVKPGETVYGLIGIRDIGYNPISLRFRTGETN